MRWLLAAVCACVALPTPMASRTDYAALWDKATPFSAFLEQVKARKDQWQTGVTDAQIDADALARARALPGRRRILVVAEDRCSDSAWAVPYLAKLAAAVPERLELRVIPPRLGSGIQSANLTPDGRLATPTVAILDEEFRFVGAWVERPAELQKWYLETGTSLPTRERYEHVTKWQTGDAGRSTIREVLAILENLVDGRRLPIVQRRPSAFH